MPTSTINSDVYINGNLAAKSQQLPSAAVGDAQIQAAANVDAYKLRHLHRKNYAQESATPSVSEARVVHQALNTGNVTDFWAGSVAVNAGAATVAVDLKKNGTSILSAPISLASTNAPRVAVAATIATPGVIAGDILEIVITATAGGGTLAKGVFATVNVNEQSTG